MKKSPLRGGLRGSGGFVSEGAEGVSAEVLGAQRLARLAVLFGHERENHPCWVEECVIQQHARQTCKNGHD